MARKAEECEDEGSGQQTLRRRRILNPNILSLTRAPPSPEVTVEEGYHLFNTFMYEELDREEVVPPSVNIEIPMSHTVIPFASPLNAVPDVSAHDHGDVTFDGVDSTVTNNLANASAGASNVSRPVDYKQLGMEIRRCADAFACSEQGRKVKEQANQVDLQRLDMQSFQELLNGVFYDGQFTLTTVIAVFVFCSTLVVRAIRDPIHKISTAIINMCFQFIKDRVCSVVQKEGGWDVVVNGVVGSLFKVGATLVVLGAALATLILLWKK